MSSTACVSRTVLPDEILKLGFHILRPIGRGKYLPGEAATAGIVEAPVTTPTAAIDLTPMPVRRLLPETVAEMDEQALFSVISYRRLLDHFTGMTIYRLRSHVRKSVPGIGQAELDAIDVGIANRTMTFPSSSPFPGEGRGRRAQPGTDSQHGSVCSPSLLPGFLVPSDLAGCEGGLPVCDPCHGVQRAEQGWRSLRSSRPKAANIATS